MGRLPPPTAWNPTAPVATMHLRTRRPLADHSRPPARSRREGSRSAGFWVDTSARQSRRSSHARFATGLDPVRRRGTSGARRRRRTGLGSARSRRAHPDPDRHAPRLSGRVRPGAGDRLERPAPTSRRHLYRDPLPRLRPWPWRLPHRIRRRRHPALHPARPREDERRYLLGPPHQGRHRPARPREGRPRRRPGFPDRRVRGGLHGPAQAARRRPGHLRRPTAWRASPLVPASIRSS